METEAKFEISDETTLRQLKSISNIGDFAVSGAREVSVHDVYMDTMDRSLLKAGYACRRRRINSSILITVKSVERAGGPVHRRQELEIELKSDLQPSDWPESAVRDLTLRLTGGAPLETLVELAQHRIVRELKNRNRAVAELSIDRVQLDSGPTGQSYYELEVELVSNGTEADLLAIISSLQSDYDLRPQLYSKFERALRLMSDTESRDSLLNSKERAICLRIAPLQNMYGRRARVLLALNEGTTQRSAGLEAGMSERRARYWHAEFRKRRMAVFPSKITETARTLLGFVHTDAQRPNVERSREKAWAVTALINHFGADEAHAHAVCHNAVTLFDHLQEVHHLTIHHRELLAKASLLHNIGLKQDADRHHSVGRDIILSHPIEDLDKIDRRMAALVVFLHRKRMTRRKVGRFTEEPYPGLSRLQQNSALILGSILRLADGLDYSQAGSTKIERVQKTASRITFHISGPQSATDARRAERKSDLWHLLFDLPLTFLAHSTARTESHDQTTPSVSGAVEHAVRNDEPDAPGITSTDTMAEAARKTLLFHYRRMIRHEPGTRLGEDIEELHDMRVATRRMRAAVRVFGPHLDQRSLAPLLKGLRRTGRALGRVRDLDVFWETVDNYLSELPEEQQPDLSPLRKTWEREHEVARQRMLSHLDGTRYQRFKEQFGAYLEHPDAWLRTVSFVDGHALPQLVTDAVPVAIYERLARVRSYDHLITSPDPSLELFHQLRIDCKRLRYVFEFFREILGHSVKELIKVMKAQQDHLGALQDAVVASSILRSFLTWGSWFPPTKKRDVRSTPMGPVIAPGVAAYLASRQQAIKDLLETFPLVWERFRGDEFKHKVLDALEPVHVPGDK